MNCRKSPTSECRFLEVSSKLQRDFPASQLCLLEPHVSHCLKAQQPRHNTSPVHVRFWPCSFDAFWCWCCCCCCCHCWCCGSHPCCFCWWCTSCSRCSGYSCFVAVFVFLFLFLVAVWRFRWLLFVVLWLCHYCCLMFVVGDVLAGPILLLLLSLLMFRTVWAAIALLCASLSLLHASNCSIFVDIAYYRLTTSILRSATVQICTETRPCPRSLRLVMTLVVKALVHHYTMHSSFLGDLLHFLRWAFLQTCFEEMSSKPFAFWSAHKIDIAFPGTKRQYKAWNLVYLDFLL